MHTVIVKELENAMKPILEQEGVVRASLFGSYVRGEANDQSDIDVLVELPEGKSLLDLISLEMKLEEKLGKEVDVVTYDSLSPLLKNYILKDQIKIL